MKKIICFVLIVIIALSAAACGCSGEKPAADIYKFEDYESSEVFDIEKIDLTDALAGKCTSYKFTYLSDGYKVKAYISIPTAAIETNQPCKCILANRGGNYNVGLLTDYTTAKACAVSNRIIVASQYRGSEGSEGEDQFGGDDLNDVIRLIDLCENSFKFVDMTDFCAAGVSRGGMMTYMAARKDSRIKRIIAVSAVSELEKMYYERSDMQDILSGCIGGTPEEKPDEYEKRSALRWADEIKVPVLMIHSRLDRQVTFDQAKDLYAKLKKNVDCTFIKYDDNVHGLHNEDMKIIGEWLDKDFS